MKCEYANDNIEVGDRATNNRLLFLLPHTFHSSHMEAVLDKQMAIKTNKDEITEADSEISKSWLVVDNESFCPGKMLKDKVLDQITQV